MVRHITDNGGRQWQVILSGRRTQYVRDELSLTFKASDGERRYVRYRPSGPVAPELAFNSVSDTMLVRLLASSQPEWTSPEGIRRPA
jgi:hypothetical protein